MLGSLLIIIAAEAEAGTGLRGCLQTKAASTPAGCPTFAATKIGHSYTSLGRSITDKRARVSANAQVLSAAASIASSQLFVSICKYTRLLVEAAVENADSFFSHY